jgi:hypothetical protein
MNMDDLLLLLHPAFGVLAVLAALWVFVDGLSVRADFALANPNIKRMRRAAALVAVFLWLSYFLGGYWYVQHYPADREIIKAGPWPFGHSLFMETKEHLFFSLLLLGTYLPIATFHPGLPNEKAARNLVLTVAAFVVLLGLVMEGSGAIVSFAARAGMLARQG